MADTKLAKVGITVKESWKGDISYEVLDYTLWRVQDGGDGCGYIAKRANIGVRPDSDDSVWIKATQAGQSIYDLAVKYGHFAGTEEEFEAEYQAALQAARDAASETSATNTEIQEAEELRKTAENARVEAETARQTAESARRTAETARETAESGRQTAEAQRSENETNRQSQETARQNAEQARRSNETARENAEQERTADFEGLKTDMQTAIQQTDAATAAADALNNQVAGDESARQTAESGRVAAETQRQTAEQGRASAESQRVSNETARLQAETAREEQSTTDHQRAESDHEIAATDHAQLEAKANKSDLLKGTLVPALAGNLESWDGSNLSVEDTWSDTVRTTAGDVSIDSSEDGRVVSVAAKSLAFSATAMRATGFNLLHDATTVGTGYYFLVPALPFGTFGTASKPNGLLFTDANGNNLRPTVVFKAIGSGVPTSVSDGVSCPYTDSNGYRFYNPTGVGYIIVSGITLADTCAHIAWSGRYDEFISPSDSADAGTTISLAALINAVHPYGQLLNVGGIADRVEWTGDTAYKWTRNNDRITPTWVSAQNEDETYTHTATISTMLAGGSAYLADGTELVVDGRVASITNDSATAPTGYVYYNLATPATGTGTADRRAAMEDWGLEEIIGASGEAFVTTQYKQGIPDTLRAMASVKVAENFLVVSEAIAYLSERVASLEKALILAENRVDIICRTINATEVFRYGVPVVLECTVAGAPAAARVPGNWDSKTMGVWTGAPRFVGQMYSDKAGKKVYFAPVITNSVKDWVLLN